MQIVPVVDLAGGLVVHAKLGDRDAYRPIETCLSATPDPMEVVAGLMRLYPFPTLYVADLDAIVGRGDNFAALARIRAAFPDLALWIDSGASDAALVAATWEFGTPVLGSESQRGAALVEATPDALLSLDFRGEAFQGPAEILARPEAWPERIIVMTLARVGSRAGPDLDRLAAIRALSGSRRLYAAGGVRDGADLAALRAAGAVGVLVASALHDGRIAASDLQ